MKRILILCSVLFLLTGCKIRHAVIVHTGTVLGLQIAENPSTSMYEARLGFARSEFAYVPSNRASDDTELSSGNGAKDTTDIMMELHYGGLLSRNITLYQRLAVGSTAVGQPGAAFMFAKSREGLLDPAVADSVAKAFKGAPEADSATTTQKLPLARRYQVAADKDVYDSIAKRHGYASFSAFLLETKTDPGVIKTIGDEVNAETKVTP